MSEDLFNGLTRENYIARWTEALRSGQYKKGTGFLHAKDGFCCLGVLCELAGLGGERTEKDHVVFAYLGETTILPDELAKHLDINAGGDLKGSYEFGDEGDLFGSLATLNDDSSATFAQIADIIEEQHRLKLLKPYSYEAG